MRAITANYAEFLSPRIDTKDFHKAFLVAKY